MSKSERHQLIEAIALKIDERAEGWLRRNNDFDSLYAAEGAEIAALVRRLSDVDLETDG